MEADVVKGQIRPLDILIYPHEILKRPSRPIKTIDGALQRFIDAMLHTMYEAKGVGLAANQVGRPVQLTVMDCAKDNERGKSPIILINPKIVEAEGEILEEEGCLSFPGLSAKVKRSMRVCLKGFDREGKEIEIEAKDGLLSRCIQHELDHLNGICLIDRLGRVRRAIFRKKLAKMRENRGQRR